MATLNKYERQEREHIWQQNNYLPNSVCEGKFFIWNKSKWEQCKHKNECAKHSQALELLKSSCSALLDYPAVQFYYVENFRKCSLHTTGKPA